MKSRYQYFAFILSLPLVVSLVIGFSPINAETKVTYIGNEGFMLQSGPAKILVDALFYDDQITYCDVPSRELLDKIEKGATPFDDIDLLLVTHWHTDHFSSSSVSRFLMNNPKCRLVCSSQVRKQLQDTVPDYAGIAHQITVPEPGSDFINDATVNHIRIKPLRLHHSPYFTRDVASGKEYDRHEGVENLGYIIDLSGSTILHVGDALLKRDQEIFKNLSTPIDIAFLEGYDISGESVEILSAYVKPKHVVYMHLPKEDRQKIIDLIMSRNPAGTVFTKPLEEKRFQ